MQDDLFTGPAAPAEPTPLLIRGGRVYRTVTTPNGLGINWTGPGEARGVVGQYHTNQAAALAAAHHIEAMRAAP